MIEDHSDLCVRAVQHPLWAWLPGMLGVDSESKNRRFSVDEDMEGLVPHVQDAYTVFKIWELHKAFHVPGYSLVRSKDHRIYKSGFKRGEGKSVLIYTSHCEGVVAIRSWLWFSNIHMELNKK